MQKNNHTPFLWNHMKNLNGNYLTGGEERPITESANEESYNRIVKLDS